MGDQLTTVEETYPSGQKYLDFYVGRKKIGAADRTEGGYLVFGRRKPVATQQEAARQMIESRIKAAKFDLREWENLMQKIESNVTQKPTTTKGGERC